LSDEERINAKTAPASGKVAAPVAKAARVDIVDVLRGFALFGVLAFNMFFFSGAQFQLVAWTDVLDRSIYLLTRLLIEAKFYSLFSLLFGWGMTVQMARAEKRGVKSGRLLVRRLLVLLMFGLIHAILIWSGDILVLYAQMGLLLLLFRKKSDRTLLIASALALLFSIVMRIPGGAMDAFREGYANILSFMHHRTVGPNVIANGTYAQITRLRLEDTLSGEANILYHIGNVFAMFLLGMYVAKRRILHDIEKNQRLIWGTMIVGLTVGLTFNAAAVVVLVGQSWVPAAYYDVLRVGFRTIGAPFLMLFYVSALVMLFQRPSWRERLAPLANLGRMAFTSYITQSVVATLIFYSYGLGLYGRTDPTFALFLTVVIYIAQIRFSGWWLARYQYGPLEWLWRTLTYGRRPPFRIGETYADVKPVRWLERLRQWWAGANRRRVLWLTWVGMVVWAIGLIIWASSLQSVVRTITLPGSGTESDAETISGDEEADDGDQAQEPENEPLAIEPSSYDPGTIAASGDLLDLAATFDVQSAMGLIEDLVGPSYLGRLAGSPQGHAAAEYIAARFAEYGLQPAGVSGSYFQDFEVPYTVLDGIPTLSSFDAQGTLIADYVLYEDFMPLVREYAGPGEGIGDTAWANECEHDDFDGVDVVGGVVICHYVSLGEQTRQAVEHGAAALFLMIDPQERRLDFAVPMRDAWLEEPLPTFWVSPSLVADLLQGSGRTLDTLSMDNTPGLLPTSLAFDIDVAREEVCPNGECLGRNVLGMLPGRDPELADEVLIIGGHFDHMGEGPDGTAWLGANDDASGVAVLLEIARSWHEQGYVPRRTVLFAAWDAEEKGLLGSIFYVENPRIPLEDTVGMIQLDMVGIGEETLSIGGSGLLEEFSAAAEAFSIEYVTSDDGGSDHVPFMQAGVPAVALTWAANENTMATYHGTGDTPEAIEPENLEMIGKITELATLGIVDAAAGLQDWVLARQSALMENNLDAFLATSSADQRDADEQWFEDFQALEASGIEINIDDIILVGRSASAQIEYRLSFESQGETIPDPPVSLSCRMEARFEHDGTWRFAGPDLAWLLPGESQVGDGGVVSSFAIAYPAGQEVDGLELSEQVALAYAEIAGLLGLPVAPRANLMLLPNAQTLRASTGLSLPDGQTLWVGNSTAKLIYSNRILGSDNLRIALTRLLLSEAGVTEAAAPWLWRGLPLAVEAESDRYGVYSMYQPRLQQAFQDDEEIQRDVAAWAATEFLRDQLGWSGLGDLIEDIGRACAQECEGTETADAALLRALGVDSEGFDAAWPSAWRTRLETVQQDLDEVLAIRQDAVLNGDLEAFLRTVNPATPNLMSEQRIWFEVFADLQFDEWSITGSPVAFLDDGQVLVHVWINYGLRQSDGSTLSGRPELNVIFAPSADGLLWSGAWFDELRGDHVLVLFPIGEQETAEIVLEQANTILEELDGRFGITLPDEVVVKLYSRGDDFRHSVAISFPTSGQFSGWTEAGASLKLLDWGDADSDVLHPGLLKLLIRHALAESGVDSEWLLKGLTVYLSSELDGGESRREAAQSLSALLTSVEAQELQTLGEMLPDHEIADGHMELMYAYAWDTLRFLVDRYGEGALESILAACRSGAAIEEALLDSIGMDLAAFEASWAESLMRAHALPEWIELANDFDAEKALEHVVFLASDEFTGRQAGTPGANLAAEYIAQQFEALGLQPVGDELQGAAATEPQDVPSEDRSYLQHFPMNLTTLLARPELVILDNQGQVLANLIYQEDFILVPEVIGSGGDVATDLVWVRDATYEGMSLNGAVVVRRSYSSLMDEVSRAVDHGAGGVILVGNTRTPLSLAKAAIRQEPLFDAPIPVLELTKDGYDRLLEISGQTEHNLNTSPPALSLDMQVQIRVLVSEPRMVESANVLGLLPGSDPDLAHEVIILGAHYDHVGDDPPSVACLQLGDQQVDDPDCIGLHYPGANDNASGIAVMLEIARLWHEGDYQPRRSILFAAWGAQEVGEAGSSYYVQNPVIPIADTKMAIQMDAVAGGSGYYLEAGFDWDREAELIFTIRGAEDAVDGRLARTNEETQGDHVPLRAAGIPTLPLAWRGAREYNFPQGFDDEVQVYRLGVTGRMVALTLMNLAR
jgi:uncharacterized protein